MYFEDISSSKELNNQSAHPIILSENPALKTELRTKTPKINELESTVSVFFFLVWITFLVIVSWALLRIFQKLGAVKIRGFSILPVSRIPCRNCKFFAKNQYLKCAVHPFTVLTSQAINCSDYCSKHESYWRTNHIREMDVDDSSNVTLNNTIRSHKL